MRMGRTERVDYLDTDEQTPDRISLYTVHSPEKDKLLTLLRLLRSLGDEKTIVFSTTATAWNAPPPSCAARVAW